MSIDKKHECKPVGEFHTRFVWVKGDLWQNASKTAHFGALLGLGTNSSALSVLV